MRRRLAHQPVAASLLALLAASTLLASAHAVRADWQTVSDLLGMATPAEALQQEYGLEVRRTLGTALRAVAEPGCAKQKNLAAPAFEQLATALLTTTLLHYSASQSAAIDAAERDKEFGQLAGANALTELKQLVVRPEVSAVRQSRKQSSSADMVSGALLALVDPLAELGVKGVDPDKILQKHERLQVAAKALADTGGPNAESLVRYDQISGAADEAIASSLDLEKALQSVEANQAQLPSELAKQLNAACITAVAK